MKVLVKSFKDLPTLMAEDGAEIREVLHPKNDPIGKHLSLAHATVEKGQETKNHILEIVEIYYILSGEGVMTVNQEQRKVKKNDAIYVYPGSEQRIKNVGEVPLRFLVICAPPFSEDKSRVIE
jgi:mannose-6-phosphate isomerase-like protein (cupin superfamily)